MKKNLLEGSILKNLILLSLPIILVNFLQIAYNLVDTFWIGRLGENAVASLSVSFPITMLLFSLAFGLMIAGSILVAQYIGRNDQKKADEVVSQTILIALITSLFLSILAYIFVPFIVGLYGVSDIVAQGAVSYLRIYFIGNVFVFGFTAIQSLFRGVGEVMRPLYIVIGTVILNLIIDPIFINGFGFIPALGIKGASLATCITQFIAFVVSLGLLLSGKYGLHLRWSAMKPDWKLIYKMFKLGLPSSLEMSSRSFGMVALAFIVASFGTTIVAAYGIGSQIFGLVMLPPMGIAMATGTMVGQGFGANKKDFVRQASNISLYVTGTVLFSLSVLIYFFAPNVVSLLIPGSPNVIVEAVNFLRIISVSFVFLGFIQVANGVFRAAGKTLLSMTIALISLWGLQVLPAYLLSHFTSLGFDGIWWSYVISFVGGGLIALSIFIQGKWKEGNLLDEVDANLT